METARQVLLAAAAACAASLLCGGGDIRCCAAAAALPVRCSLAGDCKPASPPPARAAFVTLVTGEKSDGYVNGAVALSHSLDAVGSRVPRLCMVTPDVPAASVQRVAAAGLEVVRVDPLACRPSRTIRLIRKTDHYNNFCTKVQAWTLHDRFDRLVFLDADALVLRNVDHLLGLDTAFGVAPDSGCPEHANTGVFVLQPSRDTYEAILAVNREANSFDGTDQGLLNSYCASIGAPWYFSSPDSPTCTRLPTAYNLNIDYTVDYLNLQFGTRPTALPMAPPHIIQFAGARVQKPWTAFAKAMSLYSEQNDGAVGGYIKPEYIPDEWWTYYIMWIYALAGDSATFRQLAETDYFERYKAALAADEAAADSGGRGGDGAVAVEVGASGSAAGRAGAGGHEGGGGEDEEDEGEEWDDE